MGIKINDVILVGVSVLSVGVWAGGPGRTDPADTERAPVLVQVEEATGAKREVEIGAEAQALLSKEIAASAELAEAPKNDYADDNTYFPIGSGQHSGPGWNVPTIVESTVRHYDGTNDYGVAKRAPAYEGGNDFRRYYSTQTYYYPATPGYYYYILVPVYVDNGASNYTNSLRSNYR